MELRPGETLIHFNESDVNQTIGLVAAYQHSAKSRQNEKEGEVIPVRDLPKLNEGEPAELTVSQARIVSDLYWQLTVIEEDASAKFRAAKIAQETKSQSNTRSFKPQAPGPNYASLEERSQKRAIQLKEQQIKLQRFIVKASNNQVIVNRFNR